jgi:cytochrome c biogenesis protein CcmG, thiol:disulfide interchange protein DsbE
MTEAVLCPAARPHRRLALHVGAASLLAPLLPNLAQAQAASLPELPLVASDGAPTLAAAAAGNRWRAAWIDVWASWCGPCKLSFPWMNEMHDRYAGQGLRIVAINLDKREADAQKFLQQHPARFPLVMDPQASTPKLLDVKAMPSSWLVRPDRSLLLAHRGFRLEDRADMEAAIRKALGL